MGGNPFAAVEHLDRARRQAGVDLLAEQRMRHRVEEAGDLDVVIEPNPGEVPLGIFVLARRQRLECRSLDRVEQLAAAHAETAHHPPVQALQHLRDCRVAFNQREERQVAQPTEDVGLGKAHASFNPSP